MQTIKGEKKLHGAEEAVRCWSVGFAGGAAVEAGGCVVAHGRRLQAALWLFPTVRRRSLGSLLCFRFLSYLPVSSFPLPLPLSFGFSVALSYVRLFLSPPLSLRFLTRFVSLVSSSSRMRPVQSPFIGGKGAGPHYGCMGSGAAPVSWLVGATGKARLPWFLIIDGRGALGLGRAREERKREENTKLFLLPLLHVQNDTVLVFFFF